ncbi:hypothetical protein [Mycoplasma putrefaciens]|uniref:Uncharacterized protein n=1 Tax=Mycoplasma putrefaciens Mput9231 TaxID=1292033 RepID=M9WGQ1_9MOLU|nr:hypothetical protein [Mycoplasma putrefaciens]AGJ90635.1 Hypothetical protein (part of ICE) [Mycoplasma putrefaciens Mput9231]
MSRKNNENNVFDIVLSNSLKDDFGINSENNQKQNDLAIEFINSNSGATKETPIKEKATYKRTSLYITKEVEELQKQVDNLLRDNWGVKVTNTDIYLEGLKSILKKWTK